jgi:hypothetical protein
VAPVRANARRPSARDFDFLFGEWDVENRKLQRPLSGSREWETFPTTARADPILHGLGNFDRFIASARPDEEAWEGCTLRLFDPATAEWSIHWCSTKQPGRLEPPLRGRFENGIGEFHGTDTLGGRPIRVRFYWKDITATSAVWEQAFSADDGATWEINWVMRFTRRRAP